MKRTKENVSVDVEKRNGALSYSDDGSTTEQESTG
jgi:hypothetical protein